ncbi:hypothetical protein FG386_000504 [Cryptosporidium ryanae]|uniref:uncharacterized protein n=1 Tax=Cryptosporidium ryanae TaxID=515981 RepID=UPI00351A599F|nr:hypothetical protein FG386_000504 [Cryptosporidium ryanae]
MSTTFGKGKKRQRGRPEYKSEVDDQGILDGFKSSHIKSPVYLPYKIETKSQKENNNAITNDISCEIDKDLGVESNILIQFDLDHTFGPCSNISRKERLERAKMLGIKVNKEVEYAIASEKFESESVIDKLMRKRSL